MKTLRITIEMLATCQSDDDVWAIGNEVLYAMCRQHPKHETVPEIVAKIWLIGRSYAAAIERGRGSDLGTELTNDAFYEKNVAPALMRSSLDAKLSDVSPEVRLARDTVDVVVAMHGYLVSEFRQLTGKANRSLASKYLHFHRPDLFLIYDSRAAAAVRRVEMAKAQRTVSPNGDHEYAKFVNDLLALRDHVQSEFGIVLNPRQIDRLLLAIVP